MSEINTKEIIKLPSRGKFYPKSHPFHNKEEIEIRLLTSRDEDLLTSKSALKSGEILNMLTKEILIDKSVDINTLLSGDRDAIMIYTRLLSMGTEYKAIATCKFCKTAKEYSFDLSEVPIKYSDAVPIVEGENLFSFTTPLGNKIDFSLITVQISKEISKDLEAKEKFNKKHSNFNAIETNVTTLYKHLIKSVNNNSDTAYINKYIDEMPVRESITFKKYIKQITPTVEFVSSFYCLECGELNEEVQLEFNSNFFWADF
jgi:glutaredoxin